MLGVVLLVLTLLLSFTGYLLPWDQLAFWAITVGTNIAASVPLVGEQMRQSLLGGTIIGQPTLIRFYVLHCVVLPLALFGIAAWHMWRIRKDGGLAIVEQVREEALTRPPAVPKKTKTYSILGIASGTTVQVSDPTTLNEDNSVPSTPFLTVRLADRHPGGAGRLAAPGLGLPRTARGRGQPRGDAQPRQGPVVLPGPAGAGGLLGAHGRRDHPRHRAPGPGR